MHGIAQKLESIRKRLTENDEAWGPGSDPSAVTQHAKGSAGEGGAENVSDVNDVFLNYMLSIAMNVASTFDVPEDDAIDYVFDSADAVAEEGSLPFIPEEDDLAGTAEWIGKATSIVFEDMVMAMAEEEFGEG
jgi:hypothetical protein